MARLASLRSDSKWMKGLTNVFMPVLAVLFAVIVGSLILIVCGDNPMAAYAAMWEGAFGDKRNIGETLLSATPLIFTGLGVAVAFRCSLFNIGIEGQLILGGFFAAWVGFALTGLPKVVHLPLALLIAVGAGAVWAAIPGYLKARLGVHEVVSTIMMNYIAFKITGFFVGVRGSLRAPGQLPATPPVEESARLDRLIEGTRLTSGIFLALICAVIVWYLLFRTRLGYRIRAVGANPLAAEYGGINVSRSMVLAMAISGGLAGLAGGVEVLGLHYRFYDQFSPGYGFDAIAIALLGQLHPVGVVLASLLFGSLRAGSILMQQAAGISKDLILILSALIIFFVAASRMVGYLFTIRREEVVVLEPAESTDRS
ncbi:MAG: ABC transporter permease [Chloroflexi bacterium]|nr:ABC transporter permease [Chloroflexota bacterium]